MIFLSRRCFLKGLAGTAATTALGTQALGLAGCAAPARSNQSYLKPIMRGSQITPVYHWTDIMLQAIRNQAMTPPPSARAFAMAHLAGFLAVNGIEGQPYKTRLGLEDGPSDANAEVAYGVAFSSALAEATHASFVPDRIRFLSQYPDGETKDRAIKYGRYCANAVIKDRVQDGAEPNKANFYLGRYPRRDDSLRWSPTGPFYDGDEGPFLGTFLRGHLPGWGAQKPWVMKNRDEFLAIPFYDVNSPEFEEEFFMIRELGRADSTIRTADETKIAFFWEDGPRGVTPPGHFQLIGINVTKDRGFSLLEQAKIFAMLSLGQADAAIAGWQSKYVYDIVRPETVYRQRSDRMGNPKFVGKGDPYWRSLIFTPDFPAYISGHSIFGAVSARILALCLGTDQVRFSAQAPDFVNWPAYLKGVTRSWTSLWQAAEENGASRLYGGVHWNLDNTEGLRIGKKLGDTAFNNAFERSV